MYQVKQSGSTEVTSGDRELLIETLLLLAEELEHVDDSIVKITIEWKDGRRMIVEKEGA